MQVYLDIICWVLIIAAFACQSSLDQFCHYDTTSLDLNVKKGFILHIACMLVVALLASFKFKAAIVGSIYVCCHVSFSSH